MSRKTNRKDGTLPPSSYQFILSLMILAEILVTVVVSLILSVVMNKVLGLNFAFSLVVWPVIISLVIGSILTFFISKIFFAPMGRLSRSMRRVANGNFKINLETKSRIHEIRDIYNSFNLMVKELGATEILQTDFVSNVSHEIKTPINAIEGYTTLLQDSSLTDEERQKFTELLDAGFIDTFRYFYPDQGVCILKDPFIVFKAEIRSACYSQDRDAWLYVLWDSGPVHDLMFKIGFFLAHVPYRFTRNYYYSLTVCKMAASADSI